jgi:hypothetical protein
MRSCDDAFESTPPKSDCCPRAGISNRGGCQRIRGLRASPHEWREFPQIRWRFLRCVFQLGMARCELSELVQPQLKVGNHVCGTQCQPRPVNSANSYFSPGHGRCQHVPPDARMRGMWALCAELNSGFCFVVMIDDHSGCRVLGNSVGRGVLTPSTAKRPVCVLPGGPFVCAEIEFWCDVTANSRTEFPVHNDLRHSLWVCGLIRRASGDLFELGQNLRQQSDC